MNKVTCSSCGTAYRVKPEAAGRKVRCKQCGHAIPVPAVPATSASSESQADASHDRAGLDALAPPDESTTPTMAPATAPRPRQRQQRVKVRTGPPAWLMPVAIGGGVAALIGVIALVFVLAWPEGGLTYDDSSGVGSPSSDEGSNQPANAAPDGLTREHVQFDALVIRPPAGWTQQLGSHWRFWKSGGGNGAILKLLIDDFQWPADEPLTPPRLRNAEVKRLGTIEVNGIEMEHFRAEVSGQSRARWDYYLFMVGKRRAYLEFERLVDFGTDNDDDLALVQRAVQTLERREKMQFAPPPAEDASLPDWTDTSLEASWGRHLVLDASLAMPRAYMAKSGFNGIDNEFNGWVHAIDAFKVEIKVELGKGQRQWPRVLVAGSMGEAPDAVSAFSHEITFGTIADVPFVRLQDETGAGTVRYVGHLNGDRYTFSFGFSANRLPSDKLEESIVRSFRPVSPAASATDDAPLRFGDWVIDPPRGHWVVKSAGHKIEDPKILLGHPDAGEDAVTWYLTERETPTSQLLEINGENYKINVRTDLSEHIMGYGEIQNQERFKQAGLSMTKLVTQTHTGEGHVYYLAQDGKQVILFDILVDQVGQSKLPVYDAMVRTLRRAGD